MARFPLQVNIQKADFTPEKQAFGQAAQSFKLANDAIEEIQRKNDVGIAHDTLYAFNNETRARFIETKKLRGGNAIGSADEFNQWHEELEQKYVGRLESTRARNIFIEQARARRAQSIQSLAAHEIQETDRYSETVYLSAVDTAIKDASADYLNEDLLQSNLASIQSRLGAAKPGLDNTAEYARAETAVLVSALQGAMASGDVVAAKTKLELWKSGETGIAIDPKVAATWQEKIDVELALMASDEGGTDLETRQAIIEALPMSETAKRGAFAKAKARVNQLEQYAKEKREVIRDAANGAFWDHMFDNNYVEALRVVDAIQPTEEPGGHSSQDKVRLRAYADTPLSQSSEVAQRAVMNAIMTGQALNIKDLMELQAFSELSTTDQRSAWNVANKRAKELEKERVTAPSDYNRSLGTLKAELKENIPKGVYKRLSLADIDTEFRKVVSAREKELKRALSPLDLNAIVKQMLQDRERPKFLGILPVGRAKKEIESRVEAGASDLSAVETKPPDTGAEPGYKKYLNKYKK